MRTPIAGDGIRVRAIAGTYTVLFALDADEPSRAGLLGFAIRRQDPVQTEDYWLKGLKVFRSVVPHPKKGARYTTLEQPIQSFLWGDYTAKPGRNYTYTIRPVLGSPKNLRYGADIVLPVSTEPEETNGNVHGVWFNRGAVASQFYADTFGNKPPPNPDDPSDRHTQWLSRGLLEACLAFIDKTPKGDALRIAAYEFTYPAILGALKKAIGRGVDVKIVYEAGQQKVKGQMLDTEATKANRKAIKKAGISTVNLIKRTKRKAIPHNKFIVRLRKGKTPVAVWTGSTNFSNSGFLGQTNVGHRIDDKTVARLFMEYWELLSKDPEPEGLEAALDELTGEPGPELDKPVTCVFSPRKTKAMLSWYADRIRGGTNVVMFTGGFGVNDTLAAAFAEERDYLRYLLLESPPTQKTKKLLGNDRDLIVVYGNVLGETYTANKKGELKVRRSIPGFALAEWFYKEELFRKRGHIFFVHTKILMVDPLSDYPLIFSGSANFSDNSLRYNDENMLLIRGNTRVADIYLAEYDRILRHFYFRDVAAETHDDGDSGEAVFLKEEPAEWQESYFRPGAFKTRRREMFFPS